MSWIFLKISLAWAQLLAPSILARLSCQFQTEFPLSTGPGLELGPSLPKTSSTLAKLLFVLLLIYSYCKYTFYRLLLVSEGHRAKHMAYMSSFFPSPGLFQVVKCDVYHLCLILLDEHQGNDQGLVWGVEDLLEVGTWVTWEEALWFAGGISLSRVNKLVMI